MDDKQTRAVLHIVVVGFHHKKGCQVEYSYPPLLEGESFNCTRVPEEWKFLPFLALPDGAHNFNDDTIYFHLPPRSHYKDQSTVFGVSCYRQIASNLLKRRDADVTRGTVQKSVVVLSQKPLFGILHAKLQMITQVYFEEKDFSRIEILKQLYDHVNLSVTNIDEAQQMVGLSIRSLVLRFHHQIVMLFKLILLERRLLFYASPVKHLSGGILSLLSLYPGMIDQGLLFCTLSFQKYIEQMEGNRDGQNIEVSDQTSSIEVTDQLDNNLDSNQSQVFDCNGAEELHSNNPAQENIVDNPTPEELLRENAFLESSTEQDLITTNSEVEKSRSEISNDGIVVSSLDKDFEETQGNLWSVTSDKASSVAASLTSGIDSITSALSSAFYNPQNIQHPEWLANNDIEDDDEEDMLSKFGNSRLEISTESPSRSSSNAKSFEYSLEQSGSVAKKDSSIKILTQLQDYKSPFSTDKCGFPLSIFTKGYLCLPYVALQQHEELMNNLERGYIVGATNVLFLTHTHMADVVVDLEAATLDIRDDSLKQLLHLSAADLRFADYLVSRVSDEGHDDMYLHATSWEGGDEWIQAQFLEYLVCMLSITKEATPNPKEVHDFNQHFLAAWKQTMNYRVWNSADHQGITSTKAHHPFQAQYTLSDMRLRFHHNLQSSDHGRKLETAMSSANNAVSNTGKMVGSALVSARSSVSSWWSSKVRKES